MDKSHQFPWSPLATRAKKMEEMATGLRGQSCSAEPAACLCPMPSPRVPAPLLLGTTWVGNKQLPGQFQCFIAGTQRMLVQESLLCASLQLHISIKAGRVVPLGTGHSRSRGGRLTQLLPSKMPISQHCVAVTVSTGLSTNRPATEENWGRGSLPGEGGLELDE